MHDFVTILKWYIKGKPSPAPHIVKEKMITKNRGNRTILIETGTYLGEMVIKMRHNFQKIYSIELDKKLFEAAQERFQHDQTIEILNGDSGEVLQMLLPKTTAPTLFWLDGHYSGGVTSKANLNTPIYRELNTILAHPVSDHIILIDDARLFVGEHDYPTLLDLENFISQKTNGHTFSVINDIIRITYQRK